MRRARLLLAMVLVAQSLGASAQVDRSAAEVEGREIGRAIQARAGAIVTNVDAPNQLPGYAGAETPESALIDDPDQLTAQGQAAASTSEHVAVIRDSSRAVFDPTTIDLTRATAIEETPEAFLGTGLDVGGSAAGCEPLPPGTGPASEYFETCNVGQAVSETITNCAVRWLEHGATKHRYSCTTLFQSGEVCTGPPGECAARVPVNQPYASACGAFAAAGSTCTPVSASASAIGAGTIVGTTGANDSIMNLGTSVYDCQRQIAGTAWGPGYTDASGRTYAAGSQGPVTTTGYVNSTLDVSQCAAALSISCPAGTTLEGGACVSTQSPTLVYACEAGWTLAGTTCTRTQLVPATPAGTACPAGYVLTGSSCTATQPAMIGGYTCPIGTTLSDTSCTRALTAPPTVSGYSCAEGWTLSGTSCVQTVTRRATPEYSCPDEWNLLGESCVRVWTEPPIAPLTCRESYTYWIFEGEPRCVRSEFQAADVVYSCPSNYILEGSTCTASVIEPAAPAYSCPTGYTLDGSVCTLAETVAAMPQYACPGGFALFGDQCTSSVPTTTSGYACPGGYVLAGQSCTMSEGVAAGGGYSCPAGHVLADNACIAYVSPTADTLDTCRAPLEQCTDATPTTRDVLGAPVTHSCWSWDRTYRCTTFTQADSCTALAANPKCVFDHEECLDDPRVGACRVSDRVYKCQADTPGGSTGEGYICSGDLYCIDGECTKVEREASTEFKDAMVAVQTLGEIRDGFNPDALTLFKGDLERCTQKLFGISNCCSGNGVPLLTPFLCSAADRAADTRDDAGLCHKVGSYCSDSVLGVCVTRKQSYCCFASRLTRILQEQGRAQIAKSWGTPKRPDCAGFTIAEFQGLDLSVMDFAEVYQEFSDAARIPDEVETTIELQRKIEEYYRLHAPPQG